ncbi:MAG: non-canonical purine NTP pyrophosphatase [bacterium]
MNQVLYATTNPGKFKEMAQVASSFGVKLLSPHDFGLNLKVDEKGSTLKENAKLKAMAYIPHVPEGTIVIGDDTGVEIKALGGEPGIYVRRWVDHNKELTDEEVISYCLKRMQGVLVGQRQAKFHTVLAVAVSGKPIQTFDGYLEGEIAFEPLELRDEGMPFHSIFFLPQYQKMLGHILGVYPTHREKAFEAAMHHFPLLQS